MTEPDSSVYRNNLELVCSQLESVSERVDIRGQGFAQFVFAERIGRTVEIYWAGDEGICVEFKD